MPIDVPRVEKEGLKFQGLLSHQVVLHKATLKTKDLLSCTKGINTIGESKDFNIRLHFLNNHVNIHYTDNIRDKSMSTFLDVEGCHDIFFTKLNMISLKVLLSNIQTEKVHLCLTNKGFLYILNDGEEFMGSTFRLMCQCKYDENDINTLEKLDASLVQHEKYAKKYLS